MSKLPQGWTTPLITEIALPQTFSIVDGPFGSDLKLIDYVSNGSVPVLTTKNLNGKYDPTQVRFITTEKFEQLKRSKVQSGDVLIAKIGSIGKCSIYPVGAPTAIIPANLCKISPDRRIIDSQFLLWQIRSDEFQEKLQGITSATAQPAFSVKRLKTLRLKLPPLNEQRRIVAKLEKLLSSVNAAQERLATIPRILRRFRQSVLAAACSGRLTADWRNGHRAKRTATLDETAFPEIPETWVWATIGELTQVVTGATPTKADLTNYSNDVTDCPLFKPTDLGAGKNVLKAREYVSKHGERLCRILPPTTVCVTSIGATIGKTGMLSTRGATNQQINSIVPSKQLFPDFVYYYCSSDYFQSRIVEHSSSTTLPIINKTRFEQLEIPLPPLAEQREIARRVEALFNTADALQARYLKAKAHVDKLTQSILAKAFRGELVPQDPNDEPASVLLERITAERNGSTVVKQRSRK